jgi:hypothetical protein
MTWATDFASEPLLHALSSRGVDYVVIGGVAAVLHGSPRITHDLDAVFAGDLANLRLLGRALREVNVRRPDDSGLDIDGLREARRLTLLTDMGPVDAMVRPDGQPPYERLRGRAERYELDAFGVLVAAIPDLIAMTRRGGTLQDLADIAELEAIQRLRR